MIAGWFVFGFGIWLRNSSRTRATVALILVTGALSLLASVIDTPATWVFETPFAALYFALGLGVWTTREWARRSLIAVGTALALYCFVQGGHELIANGVPDMDPIAFIASAIIGPVTLVLYGVHDDTRAHFEVARTNRTALAP